MDEMATAARDDEPAVDAWELIRPRGCIDEKAVIPALRRTAVLEPERDYRTRMLVHDALDALAGRWGESEVRRRLGDDEVARRLLADWADEYDKEGFWSIKLRLMEPTEPQTIHEMLEELGRRLREPAVISVGGSASLLMRNLLQRQTDDIDIVDELPPPIRTNHELVDGLTRRYGLRLAHFQSHYLPSGWENRPTSLGRMGRLDVFLVDAIDVLAGKVFSRREKDLDDLRAVRPHIDFDTLRERVATCCEAFKQEARSREAGELNWGVLTGENALP